MLSPLFKANFNSLSVASLSKREHVRIECTFRTFFKHSYNNHLKTKLHLEGRRKERKDKKILDKCPHCLYTTKAYTSMQTHIIRNHMSQEEQKEKFTYYCEHCKIGTLSKAQHSRHLQSKRHKEKLIYLCVNK